MFRNYLTAALRNLARNKLYAGINVVGLAIGIAAAILIALFVRDEFSYDRFIPGYEHVYLVSPIFPRPGRAVVQSDLSSPDLAAWLKLDFPAATAVTRMALDGKTLRHGNVEFTEGIGWADSNFFSILPLPAIAGDIKSALANPNGVVLTRRMARKYFGRDDVVGQTLELGSDRYPMQVLAVLEDLPSNTHLGPEVFVSGSAAFSKLTDMDAHPQAPGGFSVTVMTYVRLAPNTSTASLQRDFPAFLVRHKQLSEQARVTLELIPLAGIHLHSRSDFMMKPRGDLTTIYGVFVVGMLILVIASINFVNLMTAVANSRAVEIGIRKVVGARRRDLFAQFIGESLVYVALATLLAISIVELFLPTFNAFLERTIALWNDPALIVGIGLLGVIIGILAGLYPAFVISAFRPANVLKGGALQTGGSVNIRKLLVVLQFAILIGLMVCTAVIYRQTAYATNAALRLDTDQVLLINHRCGQTIKDGIQALPGVRLVACSWQAPTNGGKIGISIKQPNGLKTDLLRSPVDIGFFELYGLQPLAGRFFSHDRSTDVLATDSNAPMEASIVVNEAGMRALGFASPQSAIGQHVSIPGVRKETRPSEIIGVVPDFPVYSIREAVDPTVFYVDPSQFQTISVKLIGRDIPETLSAIDQLSEKLGDSRPLTRQFLSQYLQELYLDIKRESVVFAAFAMMAVFIACLGLFALSVFTAQQRTREIGIRKAMGASRGDIMRLLIWQFTKPVMWATLVAWPIAAFIMNRWLHDFAYHVDLQLHLFIASTALALAIAVLTVSLQSFLVAQAKPITVLRYE